MSFTEVAAFDVVHAHLSWPWLAFDARSERVAFFASAERVVTRVLEQGRVEEGPSFTVPADLGAKLEAFALGSAGALLAIAGASSVVTLGADRELARSSLDTLAGPGFAARALAFDRTGTRLWISAESTTETALLLVDARSHALVGLAKSPGFPPPAMHELTLHPQDDAVLLLAACGEDGTFARVAGWSGDGVEAIATALDAGGIPAGLVGFSTDGARVHLAEADELRTHAWPALDELSSVELADDFVSSFSGAVLGDGIYVDGELADSNEDAVMRFDPSGIVGSLLLDEAPPGMWAGRLGSDHLVTVESKGEPARGRILRVTSLKPALLS